MRDERLGDCWGLYVRFSLLEVALPYIGSKTSNMNVKINQVNKTKFFVYTWIFINIQQISEKIGTRIANFFRYLLRIKMHGTNIYRYRESSKGKDKFKDEKFFENIRLPLTNRRC